MGLETPEGGRIYWQPIGSAREAKFTFNLSPEHKQALGEMFALTEGKEMPTKTTEEVVTPALDGEAVAIRTAALQASALLLENVEEGREFGTIDMLRKAREFASWLSGQSNKGLAAEALAAAVVSVASDGTTSADAVISHARVILHYLQSGEF